MYNTPVPTDGEVVFWIVAGLVALGLIVATFIVGLKDEARRDRTGLSTDIEYVSDER